MPRPRKRVMQRGFLITFLSAAEFVMPASAEQALSSQTLLGEPTAPMKVAVVDARTLKDIRSGEIYRLFAIDVCALDQVATLDGQPWPCGIMATAWIVQQTLSQWVVCNPIKTETNYTIARCATSSSVDLGADMLHLGLAVLYPDASNQFPPTYVSLEQDARKSYRGLWRSKVDLPWNYRASHKANP
jgi:endonuclease YncB( thermonuclease family)